MVGLLFEEVVKMGVVCKTRTVADLGDVLLGMLQQGLRFIGQPVNDVFGGGFTGGCSQSAVKMIDVSKPMLLLAPVTNADFILLTGLVLGKSRSPETNGRIQPFQLAATIGSRNNHSAVG